MFDQAEEIVDLVNILRCNDDRPELDVSTIFRKDGGIEELELRNGVRGYLSTYTRDLPDPNVPECLDVRQAQVPQACFRWPGSIEKRAEKPG